MDSYFEYYEKPHHNPKIGLDLVLIHSIYLEQGVQKRCPAKTIAIFLEDFDYLTLPECV